MLLAILGTVGTSNTYAAAPSVQARSITFADITSTGVKISWIGGNGTGRLVVVFPDTTPVATIDAAVLNGTIYTGNPIYTSGDVISTGRAVYRATGTARNVTVTGLTAGIKYNVKIYEYLNDGGTDPEYLKSAGSPNNPRTFTTNASIAAPTALVTGNPTTDNSFDLSFTESTGATGYELDVDDNANFLSLLTDYNDLDIGDLTSFTVVGLSPGTTYNYRLRAFAGNLTSANSIAQTALTLVDNTPPTVISAERINDTQIKIYFSENIVETTSETAFDVDFTMSNNAPSVTTITSAAAVGNELTLTLGGDNLSTIRNGDNVTINYTSGDNIIEDLNGIDLVTATPLVTIIDWTRPSVYDINRVTPTRQFTNADEITFEVIFDECINGLTLSDFELNLSGSAVGTLYALSEMENCSTATVTVTGISGNGTLGLNFIGLVTDVAGNVHDGTDYTDGQVFTIDNTAPLTNQLVITAVTIQSGDADVAEVLTEDASPLEYMNAAKRTAGNLAYIRVNANSGDASLTNGTFTIQYSTDNFATAGTTLAGEGDYEFEIDGIANTNHDITVYGNDNLGDALLDEDDDNGVVYSFRVVYTDRGGNAHVGNNTTSTETINKDIVAPAWVGTVTNTVNSTPGAAAFFDNAGQLYYNNNTGDLTFNVNSTTPDASITGRTFYLLPRNVVANSNLVVAYENYDFVGLANTNVINHSITGAYFKTDLTGLGIANTVNLKFVVTGTDIAGNPSVQSFLTENNEFEPLDFVFRYDVTAPTASGIEFSSNGEEYVGVNTNEETEVLINVYFTGVNESGGEFISGSFNGIALDDQSFTENYVSGNTNFYATYIVEEGHTYRGDDEEVPFSLTMRDLAGNITTVTNNSPDVDYTYDQPGIDPIIPNINPNDVLAIDPYDEYDVKTTYIFGANDGDNVINRDYTDLLKVEITFDEVPLNLFDGGWVQIYPSYGSIFNSWGYEYVDVDNLDGNTLTFYFPLGEIKSIDNDVDDEDVAEFDWSDDATNIKFKFRFFSNAENVGAMFPAAPIEMLVDYKRPIPTTASSVISATGTNYAAFSILEDGGFGTTGITNADYIGHNVTFDEEVYVSETDFTIYNRSDFGGAASDVAHGVPDNDYSVTPTEFLTADETANKISRNGYGAFTTGDNEARTGDDWVFWGRYNGNGALKVRLYDYYNGDRIYDAAGNLFVKNEGYQHLLTTEDYGYPVTMDNMAPAAVAAPAFATTGGTSVDGYYNINNTGVTIGFIVPYEVGGSYALQIYNEAAIESERWVNVSVNETVIIDPILNDDPSNPNNNQAGEVASISILEGVLSPYLNAADGTHIKFRVKATDAAGNSTNGIQSTARVIDLNAPIIDNPNDIEAFGGNFVPQYYNSTNAGISISFLLPADATLVGGNYTLQIFDDANDSWNPVTDPAYDAVTIGSIPDGTISTSTDLTNAQLNAINGASQTGGLVGADNDGNIIKVRLVLTDVAGNSRTSSESSSVTVDETTPAAVAAPAFATTGGTLVAGYYNSTNEGVTVGFTVPNEVGGSYTLEIWNGLAWVNEATNTGTPIIASTSATANNEANDVASIVFETSDLSSYLNATDGTHIKKFRVITTDAAGNSTNGIESAARVIDFTAPAEFTIFSVITVGAPVVANYYNLSNTSINVRVPVAIDNTLTNGTIQIQARTGENDFLDVGTVATILLESSSGLQSVSLTDGNITNINGYSLNAVIEFRAIITDIAGNATTGMPSETTITVDEARPTVTSIVRTNNAPAPTNASTVSYTVTFSEEVYGVEIADFAVGSAGSIASVTRLGESLSVYTVVCSTSEASYTSTLTFTGEAQDAAVNVITNKVATTNQTYSVDRNIPTISGVTFAPSSGLRGVGQTVVATVTLTGNESAGTFGTLTINGVTATGAALTFNTPNTTFTATYTVVEGNDDVADAAALPFSIGFTDAAGNAATAFTQVTLNNAGLTPGIDANSPTLADNGFYTPADVPGIISAGLYNGLVPKIGLSYDGGESKKIYGALDASTNDNVYFRVRVANDPSLTGGTIRIRKGVSIGHWTEIGSGATIQGNFLGSNVDMIVTEDQLGASNINEIQFQAEFTDVAGNVRYSNLAHFGDYASTPAAFLKYSVVAPVLTYNTNSASGCLVKGSQFTITVNTADEAYTTSSGSYNVYLTNGTPYPLTITSVTGAQNAAKVLTVTIPDPAFTGTSGIYDLRVDIQDPDGNTNSFTQDLNFVYSNETNLAKLIAVASSLYSDPIVDAESICANATNITLEYATLSSIGSAETITLKRTRNSVTSIVTPTSAEATTNTVVVPIAQIQNADIFFIELSGAGVCNTLTTGNYTVTVNPLPTAAVFVRTGTAGTVCYNDNSGVILTVDGAVDKSTFSNYTYEISVNGAAYVVLPTAVPANYVVSGTKNSVLTIKNVGTAFPTCSTYTIRVTKTITASTCTITSVSATVAVNAQLLAMSNAITTYTGSTTPNAASPGRNTINPHPTYTITAPTQGTAISYNWRVITAAGVTLTSTDVQMDLITLGLSNAIHFTTVIPFGTYYVQVQAKDDCGESAWPANDQGFQVIISPTQSTGLSFSSSSTTLSVTWVNGTYDGNILLGRRSATNSTTQTLSGDLDNTNLTGIIGISPVNPNVTWTTSVSSLITFGGVAVTDVNYLIDEVGVKTASIKYLYDRPQRRFDLRLVDYIGTGVKGSREYLLTPALIVGKNSSAKEGIEDEFTREGTANTISAISPNPAKDFIAFDMELVESTNVTIIIHSLEGREVLRFTDGQMFGAGKHNINIPLKDFISGAYGISISFGNEAIFETFMINP